MGTAVRETIGCVVIVVITNVERAQYAFDMLRHAGGARRLLSFLLLQKTLEPWVKLEVLCYLRERPKPSMCCGIPLFDFTPQGWSRVSNICPICTDACISKGALIYRDRICGHPCIMVSLYKGTLVYRGCHHIRVPLYIVGCPYIIISIYNGAPTYKGTCIYQCTYI